MIAATSVTEFATIMGLAGAVVCFAIWVALRELDRERVSGEEAHYERARLRDWTLDPATIVGTQREDACESVRVLVPGAGLFDWKREGL